MRYASLREPTLLPIAQRVLAIPVKRFDRPVLGYLSRDEITTIIDAPDRCPGRQGQPFDCGAPSWFAWAALPTG